jgi:Chloramphenicol phosphotransferase-like protein
MARSGQIRSGAVRTLQAAAASGRDMGQQTAARTRFYAMIIDEVFMGGRSAQERLAAALSGVPVVWVGVQCDPDVAETRERARLDPQINLICAIGLTNIKTRTPPRSAARCALSLTPRH